MAVGVLIRNLVTQYPPNHVRHIHLAGKRNRGNNNKMERLNGKIRDREKVLTYVM